MSNNKTLVAYFSCSGVTRQAAEILAKVIKADLYEITPQIPYTAEDLNWRNQSSRSSIEMRNTACRPEIAGTVEDMDQYDTVFVGFPIWWYVAPSIIHTFLEAYDFSGKTVVPFATSGGSGLGKTEEKLRESCSPNTKWRPGRLLNQPDQKTVRDWVRSL